MSKEADSAFVRTFGIVLGLLVVFTVSIIFVANMIGPDAEEVGLDNPRLQAEIDKRIAPVARENIAGADTAGGDAAGSDAGNVAAEPMSGAKVVETACFACHGTGAAGAPKIGDKAEWEARLAQSGFTGLMTSGIKGKGAAMPAKGGNPTLSDADIEAAILTMLKDSGIEIAAPSADAGVASVADEATEAVNMAAAETAAAPAASEAAGSADLAMGKKVYDTACFACHNTGVAGAPKLGDKAAWGPRIQAGAASLLANAMNGKGGMPPKGGAMHLSENEIANAVAYMVSEGQ